jgi:hypothetical protein
MKNGGNAWPWHWRRFLVDAMDVLIGASALVVAYATIDAAADFRDLLIAGVIALVGIGLMLEPNATAQRACDTDPQPLRPPVGPKLRDPDGFDAAITGAMSL